MVCSAEKPRCENLIDATILFADNFTPACIAVRLVLCLGAHVAHASPFFVVSFDQAVRGFRLMGKAIGEWGGLLPVFVLIAFRAGTASNGRYTGIKPAFLSLSGVAIQLHTHTHTTPHHTGNLQADL